MKKLNMYLVLAGLISSLVIFSGCDQPGSTSEGEQENNKYIPVSSVTLSKTSISGSAGDSIEVTATVMPENATDKTLSWQNISDKVSIKTDQNDTSKATINILSSEAGSCEIYVLSSNKDVYATLSVTIVAKPTETNPDNQNENNPDTQKEPDNPEQTETPKEPEIAKEYSITISEASNGSVTTEKTQYKKGETVVFTVTPDKDYALNSLFYYDENHNKIIIEKNADEKYQIEMPESNITVYSDFKTIYDPIKSVIFSNTELTIAKGDTTNLEYTVSPENANYELSFVVADKYSKYYSGTIASITESTDSYISVTENGAVTAEKTGSGKMIFAKVIDKAYNTTSYFGPVNVIVKEPATIFKITTTNINVKAGDKCQIDYSMYDDKYSSNVIVRGLKITNTCSALKFNGLGYKLTTSDSIEEDFVSGEVIFESDDFPTYKVSVCVYKDEIPESIKFDKRLVVLKPNETYTPNTTIPNVKSGVYTPKLVVKYDDIISATGNTLTAKKTGYSTIFATIGNIRATPTLAVLVTDSEYIEKDDFYSISFPPYSNDLSYISGIFNSKNYSVELQGASSDNISISPFPIITKKDGKKIIEAYIVVENLTDSSVKEDVIMEPPIAVPGNAYIKDKQAVYSSYGRPFKCIISNISDNGIISIDGKTEATTASLVNAESLPKIIWKDITLEKGEFKIFTLQLSLEELKEKSFEAIIY